MSRPRTLLLVAAIAAAGLVSGQSSPSAAAEGDRYVSCTGSDSASGTSASTAWRTLDRAEQADLGPGDTVRLHRGCTWTGQRFDVAWNGSAAAPVTVATYGSGTRPVIRNGPNSGVKITGDHVTISGLSVDFDVERTDPCGQPLGEYYGFNITDGATNVTVRDSVARRATAGLHVSRTAGGGHLIADNEFVGNNVMTEPFDGTNDLGAWGILMRGDDSIIERNEFRSNRAVCTKGGERLHSNSIEIFEGRDNLINANRSTGDRVFSELGSSAAERASGNRFTFNIHTSDAVDARFITTRGAGDTQFGPVNATIAERNTIRHTGAGSQGLVCILGCTPSVLTARFNIIDVVDTTIFFDGTMGQERNLLWAPGPVTIQDGGRLRVIAPGVDDDRFLVADPQFVSAADLRLRPSSPAIGRADDIGLPTDVSGSPAVVGAAADIGAHEYTAPSAEADPACASSGQPELRAIVGAATSLCGARRGG